ncbi:TVP38/TMEM64 family protein [Kineosporia sp. R_H_3]|uniref:TVP38/TMEM64 family protein n=1 Tax=Kineosporia sp. R_H_3 TaxID=1961848 RepID=UPI0013043059|nr:TVP38/TMEM64 family protein [Kineosporia sp. R_H_3]
MPDDAAGDPSRGVWLRLAVLLLIVGGAAAVVAVRGVPDVDSLKALVADAGTAGPVLFVVVYALATLAPLPKNVLSAAAGVVFGIVAGTGLVLVAALLGAVAAFWLGRALGRDGVRRLTGRRLDRLDQVLERRGVLAVVAVRLVPVFPFTAVNYGSGLLGVRFRDYLLGTAVGIVPGTVAFVALGHYGTAPRSWQFALSVVVLGALSLGGWVAGRRHRMPPAGPPAGTASGTDGA